MIKKLILKSFGKFKEKEFSFHKITLFKGKNEAGKTTLFDCLLDNLCEYNGKNQTAKALANRYGERTQRSASIEQEGDSLKHYPYEEFLNLYAVKAGNIETILAKDNEWITKIKASLFTGGIDPQKIRQELEDLSSDHGGKKHNKAIKNKDEELNQKEKQLEEIKKEKELILNQDKQNEELKNRLDALTEKIESLQKEYETLKKKNSEQIALKEKKNQLEKINGILLNVISKINDLSLKLESLKRFEVDRKNEPQTLNGKIQDLQDKIKGLEFEVNQLEKDKLEKIQKYNKLKGNLDQQHRLIEPLNRLIDRIEKETPQRIIRQQIVWNKALLVIASVLGIMGLSAAIFMNFNIIGIVIFITSFLLGGVIGIKAKTVQDFEEMPDITPFYMEVLKIWKEIYPDNHYSGTSLSQFREYLIRFKSDYFVSEKNARELHEDKSKVEENGNSKNLEKTALTDELRELKSQLQAWFANMQVSNLEEYVEKTATYGNIKIQYQDLSNQLKGYLNEYSAADISSLKTILERKANGLQKELEGMEIIQDFELKKMNQKVFALELELKIKEQDKNTITREYENKKGRVEGSLKNKPEEILNLNNEINKIKKEIFDLGTDKKAAGLAAEIFSDIAKDSSLQFGIISKDIATRFSEFIPGIKVVEMKAFDNNQIAILDSGKQMRAPEHLSTGTKDAFWLAARLALAIRSNPQGPGILVLDEPFHSFDNSRIEQAIQMLKKFAEETKWQLVLFTKDGFVAEKMSTVFSEDIILHELGN